MKKRTTKRITKKKKERWACFPTCYNDQQSENEEKKKEKCFKKLYGEKNTVI